MELFDEIVRTTVNPDGTAEETRWAHEEAMREACGMFLTAERRFRRLDTHPDVVKDSKLNLQWWDALESLYERDKALWRMFVGSQPTMADNKLYARFREMLLKGGSLKANA